MKKLEALKIIAKYCPCSHENHEIIGGGNWLKCHDCQETISPDNLEKYKEKEILFLKALKKLEK